MKLNVLLVDDLAQDRTLVRRELLRAFHDVDIVEVSGPRELEQAFTQERVDLVISDYALGWGDGLGVLRAATEHWPSCGTIMYTGTGNEEVAVAAMKAGFDDYVVKSNHHLKELPDIARRVLDRRPDTPGRPVEGAEDPEPGTTDATEPGSVRDAVGLLQAVTAAANGAETLADALEAVLPELCAGTGWPAAHAWRAQPERSGHLESTGTWCLFDPSGFKGLRRVTTNTRLRSGQGLPGRAAESRAVVWIDDMGRADDSPRAPACRRAGIGAAVAVPVLVGAEPVAVVEMFRRDELERDHDLVALLERTAIELGRVAARERAERRRSEMQARLMTSGKMEAIGRLAGGVAHDFNNLLAIMALEAEEALEADLPPAVRRSLGTVLKTTERAGRLTHSLLTFGRRTPGTPTSVQASEMVREMRHLLEHLTGPRVTVRLQLEGEARVHADRSQLEQVLANLVINARDAMPEGGQVTVGVRERHPVLGSAEGAEIDRSDCVILSVSDTGPGIPEGLADRIFEPFFSTKGSGPGTGLGLAVCHGVVEELGGRIRVESRAGKGATFELVLPAEAAGGAAPSDEVERTEDKESILLVQDEADLRSVLTRLLRTHGYDVLAVSRGEEAMEILESGRSFDVIIADVGLPGIQGPELARGARVLSPASAVMLTTGYSEMAGSPDRIAELGVDDIVKKPFAMGDMLSRIRTILDRKRKAASRAS